MNSYGIKHKGYNTNSGLLYTRCGMSQYKTSPLPINNYDTGEYSNPKMEKKVIPKDREVSDKVVMKVEKQIENKEDPSKGSAEYRIEPKEKMPMRLEAKVPKENYPQEPDAIETNLYLK